MSARTTLSDGELERDAALAPVDRFPTWRSVAECALERIAHRQPDGVVSAAQAPALVRNTFRTSRLLDFFSAKELIAQTGHREEEWPLVALKEIVDNALDACEDAGIAPEVSVTVDDDGMAVADNGPGLPTTTLDGVLDFSVRVSSREAYVAPDRGLKATR